MRTKTIELYTFEELSEKAKETARNWWRDGLDFAWGEESLDSIRAFCTEFGAQLTDWNIGPHSPLDYTVKAENQNFRGRKLKEFNRDAMPTGYCLDCDLYQTFYDEFKRTGSAKKAFEEVIEAGFKAWRTDMESQLEDEYIDDCLVANEYEFTKEGERA